MSWFVLPSKRSPAVAEEIATAVYTQLSRLFNEWRTDPDRLAVALSAWCLAGYPGPSAIDEVASGYPGPTGYISDDQARAYIDKALRGRHARVLRLRGEGLLLGLEALATDAEFARLHQVREESAIIECRELTPSERVERLATVQEREADRA